MQSLQFIEPGKLEWAEVLAPRLESDDDAIVSPIAGTICDLDRSILLGGTPMRGPFAFGHECVGRVVEAGPNVRFRPGQRVVIPWNISCGSCRACVAGRTSNCQVLPAFAKFGFPGKWGGMFSDLVRLPHASFLLVPLPSSVDPAHAASISDNLTDAWSTVAPHLAECPNATVLVLGGVGSSPLYAVDVAVACGASRVLYFDTNLDRCAIAEQLGAEVLEGPLPRCFGKYDITVDGSADPEGLACAVRSTARGGVCTSFGIYFGDTPLPLYHLYMNGIRFHTGRSNVRHHIPSVIELMAGGRLRPQLVSPRIFDWSELIDVLQDPPLKPIFTRQL